MTSTSRRLWWRAAAGAAALGLLVGGWTAATADEDGSQAGRVAVEDVEGPGPSDSPDPGLAGEPVPTLPPGDPGVDGDDSGGSEEPDDSDPGSDPDSDDDHDGEGVTEVPVGAMLDAETVSSIAGSPLSAVDADADCTTAAPAGASASRSLRLRGDGGSLTETVAGYGDNAAAIDAVAATVAALAGCGFTEVGDPRLGEASTELTRSTADGVEQRGAVLALEGALVVLVADGATAAPGAWESLVDLALGTSCAAAPHGCH